MFNLRGVAYIGKGEYDRAIADHTRAIELDPKYGNAFSNRSAAYFVKGDYDRAIADATRAIELDPKSADAFVHRSAAHVFKGDYDSAIADATRAIELDPKDASAFNNRGRAYLEKAQSRWVETAMPSQSEHRRASLRRVLKNCDRSLRPQVCDETYPRASRRH